MAILLRRGGARRLQATTASHAGGAGRCACGTLVRCSLLESYRDRFPILEHTTYLINHSLGAMPVGAEDGPASSTRASGASAASAHGPKAGGTTSTTVGDQLGRDRRRGAGHDGDAPERRRRRGGRALVLRSSSRRATGSSTARASFPRFATSTRRSTGRAPRSRSSRRRRGGAGRDRRADAARADQPRPLQDRRDPGRRGDRQPRARGRALVVLDAYQSAGSVPLDVTALGVDFAVGGCVKWLCGGPGAGWLYVRPDLAERLEPTVHRLAGARAPVRVRARAATTPQARPGS